MYKGKVYQMGIIDVIKLKKYFPIKKSIFSDIEWLKAVDDVTFSISEGKVLSLVGESGSGKSTVAMLILRLINPTSGKILFKGKDIFKLKGESLKEFRKKVQIIFQDPFASLNPRMTVYNIISEPLKIHNIVKKELIMENCLSLLKNVGLDPDILNRYPHEFSGGQRQRICIARAIALSPEVLIADEPLSSLDVSIQAQILTLIQELQKKLKLSMLFISHDLNVVRYISDEVVVMYLGKIVEYASAEDLFNNPLHPYTIELLSSIPGIRSPLKKYIFKEEYVSELPQNIKGCVFYPRCNSRLDICKSEEPELKVKNNRLIACHL